MWSKQIILYCTAYRTVCNLMRSCNYPTVIPCNFLFNMESTSITPEGQSEENVLSEANKKLVKTMNNKLEATIGSVYLSLYELSPPPFSSFS